MSGASRQYIRQVGKILRNATQDRIPVAFTNGKKLSVKPGDSMTPEATDDAFSDESRPSLDCVGIKLAGAKEDKDAVPENSMPSLEDDGRKKTAAIPKQEIPGVGGPPPLSTSRLPQAK